MGERLKDLRAIFLNALEIEDREQRKAYLDDACRGDDKLRADVEALLAAHEQAGDFLGGPPIASNATLDSSPRIDGPGTVIGRYQLLELIGEGGMGLVYLAEQKEPVRRRVAFKIIKPGMDSKQVIARFEAERQALAVLDHPNIAHVFDAGCTETGRPYFVMEHVKGLSITRYCDEYKLTIEQRLRLFEQVCEGVQHAHQKGIIHRDLKPSNILVTMQGDKPVPKIIDFGIAKAITSPLTDMTFVTLQGQLLGTPEYMSPEQVDLAAQDIDTRSDIYSLGVVLYELLAGVLPFESESFTGVGLAEVQRTIREDEPASPSIRLTQMGDKAKGIAESRGTHVVPLARRLHRELEWIPLKAMRKDRCRRYRSASEMADDVHNYLAGRPLIAGPETAIYRVQKFVRKHAGSVATVALVAIAVLLGLAVSTAMYFRAEDARQKEAAARTQAEQAEQGEQQQRKLAEEKAEEYRRAFYCNRVALADAYYRAGDINGARALLELCPADLRRWEWNRLDFVTRQSIMTLRGHTDLVQDVTLGATELINGIALNADGTRIASAGRDRTVRIWDASTGANLMTLRGHEQDVLTVSFSPDGKRIVSAGKDQTIRVWDVDSGKDLMTLRGHEGYVGAVFSPDGELIVSGSQDQTIKVWDAQTGQELRTLKGHEGAITCHRVGPDGKSIVSGSRDKTIRMWDLMTGDLLRTMQGHTDIVTDIAFSPDGTRIVSGSRDASVKIWDVQTGEELKTLRGHSAEVGSVAFSPDGKLVASGSYDLSIRVWDSETGAEVKTFGGHEWQVTSLAFCPDGKRLVSGSWDGTIKVWDLTGPTPTTTLGGHAGVTFCVALSPDGEYVASGGQGGIRLYNARTGAETIRLGKDDDFVPALTFSPDGSKIASSDTMDPNVKIWDVRNGAILHVLQGHTEGGGATGVAFTPDGARLVSGSADGTVRIWDAATGTEIRTLRGHTATVYNVACSPDASRIASGSLDGTVRVWDANGDAEPMTLRGHTGVVWCVAFSPDGTRIASGGGMDKTIRIWDASSGRELRAWRAHGSIITGVSFSPDGERIASASADGTIKVWDAVSVTELMTLPGQDFWSVAFSPDGKTIASAQSDGTIKLWRSEAQRE
jgi:WD40 repeat protein/tRNA A-37 threonylcarbamoyl transferase component Bud32